MDTRLFDLTTDNLQNEVARHLGAGSFINFARTSKYSYSLFQDEYQLALPVLKSAADHAVCGEWDDVDRLLRLFPDLLTCRVTVQHHGRYKFVDRFLWQIALMNEEGDNVYDMFKKHFERLPGGLEEMKKQFHEVFPDGEMIKYGWDLEEAKKRFDKAYDAMLIDKTLDERDPINNMNPATNNVLQAFYAYVTPKPTDAFAKGLLFDIQLFQYVVDKYAAAFSQLNWNQRVFYGVNFWDYLVLKLPTGYLRPVCQGLYYVVDRKEPLTVNGCRLRTDAGIGTGAAILPIGTASNFVFGRSFIDILGRRAGGAAARGGRAGVVARARPRWVGNLCRAKATSTRNFMQQLQRHPHPGDRKQSSCVIL